MSRVVAVRAATNTHWSLGSIPNTGQNCSDITTSAVEVAPLIPLSSICATCATDAPALTKLETSFKVMTTGACVAANVATCPTVLNCALNL